MKVLLEFLSQKMSETDANKLIEFIKENAPNFETWDMSASIIEDDDYLEEVKNEKI